MKYLLVGLGNIGSEYAAPATILDSVYWMPLPRHQYLFTTERYGDIGRGRVKNAQVVLLKPSTYMNLSGNAVRYWLQHENIDIANMIVAVDDLALPFELYGLAEEATPP